MAWSVVAIVGLILGAPLAATGQAQPNASAAAAQPVEPPPPAPPSNPSHAPADPAAAPGHQPEPTHGEPAAGKHEAEEHGESPWALVARIFNFVILAGGLVYFLRSPVTQHLAARGQQVRAGLVSARETTDRAQRQLSEIDRRLKELPAEIEALRARGAEEVAAEGVRIKQQAEAERHRLLEEARRDLDIQVRLAKQALTEHAATLAVQLASDRIARTITPDDQTRLIDRYVARVKEIHG